MTYQQLKEKIWKLLTHGALLYITAPIAITLLILFFILKVYEGGTKFSFLLKELRTEKTSYLSKHELEVLDEWVALIDYADTYEQAIDRSNQFKKAYEGLGHGLWGNNILYIRDPSYPDRWMIIVDMWSGKSSYSEVNEGINSLKKDISNAPRYQGRDLEDTLGMWLFNSHPVKFDVLRFQQNYGKITNLPESNDASRLN
ncbi:hypothetical protein [Rubellicoccus peritrichatus]|uniref:Uncharacterized protein n=1 Tax=Rubellicoccus peritrichatus TaxID=3080537 RepID=A0AAQ3QTQ8_9BACT|nr:hypothetical protein [Puniceicoccus sp. CR14]WOO39648.1 hypothetical protein RZN69_13575 [Puniceicoccus sp. CR14]